MENKKNKGIIVIFVIFLIIILSLVGYFIYQNVYIGNLDDKNNVEDKNDLDDNNAIENNNNSEDRNDSENKNNPEDKNNSEDNSNPENKNTYQLKKFAHYTNDIFSGTMEFNGEYYIVDSSNYLDVYNKKGQNIYHAKGYFSNNGSYIYTSNNKFADYANIGLSKETYDNIYAVRNHEQYFRASQNNKWGVIDKQGKTIIPFEYQLIIDNNGYFTVQKDNKVGIMDLEGKVVVPLEYEILDLPELSGFTSKIVVKDKKVRFILYKNNNYYVVDSSNNIIMNNENRIFFDDVTSNFVIQKDSKLNFYSLDGKFIKSIELEKDEVYSQISLITSFNSFGILHSNNKLSIITKGTYNYRDVSSDVRVIDQKLNVKKIKNIYYDSYPTQGVYVDYYVTDDIYVTENNNVYNIRSMTDDKKIYDKDFSYVKWIKSLEKLFVCDDNACYFLNEKGEKVDDLTYSKDFANKNIEDFHNNNVLVGNSSETMFSESGFDLYTSDYKKINDKKFREFIKLENGYLIATLKEKQDNSDNILIYDNNNELVEYENLDNAKLKLYLGKANGYLFFLTDKGIYNIQID